MASTIQVSDELKEVLSLRKMSKKDCYEDIIWDLLEDVMELSKQTKKEIIQAKKEIEEGKFVTHEQLREDLGI